jgi:hypothetical protein
VCQNQSHRLRALAGGDNVLAAGQARQHAYYTNLAADADPAGVLRTLLVRRAKAPEPVERVLSEDDALDAEARAKDVREPHRSADGPFSWADREPGWNALERLERRGRETPTSSHISRGNIVPKRLGRVAVAALVAALSLSTAAACSTSGKDAPKASASSDAVPKTAKNDSWSWTVSKVAYAATFDSSNTGPVKPDESGKTFGMVTTKIKNLTAQTQHYTIHLADAYDVAGEDYEAWAFLIGDRDLEAGFDIGANQEVPAVIVFQIPPGTKIATIGLGDSFDGQVKIKLT